MTDPEKILPLPALPGRNPESHKGDYGHVLLVGGSRGMSGAIALAGIAALRGGAGRVTVATADRCQDVVSSFEPSYMTAGLPAVDDGTISSAATEKILNMAEQATVVGCGPGIGRTDATFDVVAKLFEHLPRPTVFDADALFALAARNECLRLAKNPRILTPHEGELARLVNQQGATRAEREQAGDRFRRSLCIDCRPQGTSHPGNRWIPYFSQPQRKCRDGHGWQWRRTDRPDHRTARSTTWGLRGRPTRCPSSRHGRGSRDCEPGRNLLDCLRYCASPTGRVQANPAVASGNLQQSMRG